MQHRPVAVGRLSPHNPILLPKGRPWPPFFVDVAWKEFPKETGDCLAGVGRELQKRYGQPAQCVLMMPLLEGLDGINKMSKSLGNYLGINEAPKEIFGKIMSISDDLTWRYYDLLSFKGAAEIQRLRMAVVNGLNPWDDKVQLAQELVARSHSQKDAAAALIDFEARFRQGVLPDDMPECELGNDGWPLAVVQALKLSGLTGSASELLLMIDQGGVRTDGEKVADKSACLAVGVPVVLQVGKRKFARVVVS